MIYGFIFYASVLLSTLTVILAFITVSWRLMLVSIFLSLPYVLYLSAMPSFSLFFIYPLVLGGITLLLYFRERKYK